MDRLRVSIIGAGRQGRRRAESAEEAGDSILRVADINMRAAGALAGEFGGTASRDWRDAVSDPGVDTVVVCTPNDLHATVCIATLRAGKNVLCEKPLARNPREAHDVLAAARRSDGKLKCGFNLRFHPAISAAKKLFAKRGMGKVMVMRCRYGTTGRPGFSSDWRTNAALSGGGELMDQGVHVLDLFRWFGGEFDEAFGYAEDMFWKTRRAEDNAFALLRSRSGMVGSLHVSWTEWKNLFSFEVFGKSGYARIEGLGGSYGDEKLVTLKRDLERPFSEVVTEFRGADSSWVKEWMNFSGAIRGQNPLEGDAYDGFAAVKLAYAIYDSARSRRSVRLRW